VLNKNVSRMRKTARAREKRLAHEKNGPRMRKTARAREKQLAHEKKGSGTR